MGRKKTPDLIKRQGVWHIDKRIGGRRVCQSTGSAEFEEAERFLARLMEETRQAQVYGVRPSRSFERAAAKFVLENQHKRSLQSDIGRLKSLLPWIGEVALDRLHRGTLEPWIEQRHQGWRVGGDHQPWPQSLAVCIHLQALDISGGQGRNRTVDTRIFNPLLYQLSYLAVVI